MLIQTPLLRESTQGPSPSIQALPGPHSLLTVQLGPHCCLTMQVPPETRPFSAAGAQMQAENEDEPEPHPALLRSMYPSLP